MRYETPEGFFTKGVTPPSRLLGERAASQALYFANTDEYAEDIRATMTKEELILDESS